MPQIRKEGNTFIFTFPFGVMSITEAELAAQGFKMVELQPAIEAPYRQVH